MRPCFEPPKDLEEAAAAAEQRKHRAIEMLAAKLGIAGTDGFEKAMRDLVDADKRALQESGK